MERRGLRLGMVPDSGAFLGARALLDAASQGAPDALRGQVARRALAVAASIEE